MKFRIIWRMLSVDSAVAIPSLLANRELRVLFPVPDVPPSRTTRDCSLLISYQAVLKSSKCSEDSYFASASVFCAILLNNS